MKEKEIFRFLRKLIIISLPFDIIILCYLAMDPFKVIWLYDRYFDNDIAHVALNMNYVSSENFATGNTLHNYNAFILGNSRSQYWQTDYWQQHIGREARCYHFYGNGHTLYGVHKDIQFIDRSGNKIEHALLVVDAELLSHTEPKKGHLFCTAPRVIGYRNLIKFHTTNFVAFLQPLFIVACIDHLLHKTLRPYMQEKFLFEQPIVYNPDNNEITDRQFDLAIQQGTYYNRQRMMRFHNKQHPDSTSAPVLMEENRRLLTEIAQILHRHTTQYKVVISPLYNQIKFNPADLKILHDIFGKDNVYDFSGDNAITRDYHNYYEESHYRPAIAQQLMDSLYSQQRSSLQKHNR